MKYLSLLILILLIACQKQQNVKYPDEPVQSIPVENPDMEIITEPAINYLYLENNVINQLFHWPVKGEILFPYGRFNTNCSDNSFHDGIDIAAPIGTPIKASMSGRIESIGNDNFYGNFVIIRHVDGYKTLYGLLGSSEGKSGDYVDINTVIGIMGISGRISGNGTTSKLHFTIYKDGSSINPRLPLQEYNILIETRLPELENKMQYYANIAANPLKVKSINSVCDRLSVMELLKILIMNETKDAVDSIDGNLRNDISSVLNRNYNVDFSDIIAGYIVEEDIYFRIPDDNRNIRAYISFEELMGWIVESIYFRKRDLENIPAIERNKSYLLYEINENEYIEWKIIKK
jgi:hypothetical protein